MKFGFLITLLNYMQIILQGILVEEKCFGIKNRGALQSAYIKGNT